jgi:prophage maintenance system killer protein
MPLYEVVDRPYACLCVDGCFLQKNGSEIVATEEEAYSMMMSLASGKLSKDRLPRWLKEHSAKFTRRSSGMRSR